MPSLPGSPNHNSQKNALNIRNSNNISGALEILEKLHQEKPENITIILHLVETLIALGGEHNLTLAEKYLNKTGFFGQNQQNNNSITNFVQKIKKNSNIIYQVKEFKAKEAKYGVLNRQLPNVLSEYLKKKEIRLYTHQCESINQIRNGKNIILTSATASGKTLAFNLPIIEKLIENSQVRALYLYPTKALSQDQLKALQELESAIQIPIQVDRYDYDTLKSERANIRSNSRIVISNPYMLHRVLPHHNQWSSFFKNLHYVVIDEAHYYRGVFGSNVAYVIRRLKRIARLYGAKPQFILLSATIGNAEEFGTKLIGESIQPITIDGSARGEKTCILLSNIKTKMYRTAVHLLVELVQNNISTICFVRRRRMADQLGKWIIDDLEKKGKSYKNRVRAYHAGYTVKDRKEIENDLKKGNISVCIASNALELGIDIGSLDGAVLTGYPGSIMSFWQQAGRSGRRNKPSLAIMICHDNALEQFFLTHPEDFFTKKPEDAVIDLNNKKIFCGHLLCASDEYPITSNDNTFFGDKLKENIESLLIEDKLKVFDNNRYKYFGIHGEIQREVELKSIPSSSYKIMKGDKILETLTTEQAYREAHEGAIITHMGESFMVSKLDLDAHTAFVESIPKNITNYTQSQKYTNIHHTQILNSFSLGSLECNFGEVTVENNYYKYKTFNDNQEVIEENDLHLPPIFFESKGFWFDIPQKIIQNILENCSEPLESALEGTKNILKIVTPYFLLCDPHDIDIHIDYEDRQIFTLYDEYSGGIGISERMNSVFPKLIEIAIKIIKNCPCNNGCPSCVCSSINSDNAVDKSMTTNFLELLQQLLNQEQSL
ncbi:DEAD/DEAH box helicase [Methanospirillum purgamenti]|uniref:DEAD/DEAH box helicase n=1 Tax=Methanospirillum hungatei TaxID=2203 RepID=A0A8F5VN56_METHU|nr:DEAD/DEAH box helicase [Methanospirillum hungatei]QXO95869.1 DEAD/DEAH box helicase [Methanospirillum hungatei]